jgi:phospholipase C
MGYDLPLDWTTFPDRLERHGVSWRIYQNEISVPTGFSDEEDSWLSNFDDNPLEYFVQYKVRFSRAHRRYLAQTKQSLSAQLTTLRAKTPASPEDTKKIAELSEQLRQVEHDLANWTDEAFASLPAHEQNLHRKAFTTNEGDPDYRALTGMSYRDGEVEREMQIPKGDVLYQFREDVRGGKLPTISWIVAPERFSDHPSSAWYGAWYISETMDILTHNPEVWKKTIFIVCYDENDGYYDHVPPFVPPWHDRPETGKASAGIDTSVEFTTAEQEAETAKTQPGWQGVPGPIGLGFRVPLLIASPWSRGGYVNSQVFDHTSLLRLMETFLTHKTGRPIRETNISSWRRTVCGDLTSTFRPYHGERIELPQPVERDAFFSSIHEAQFKPIPNDYGKMDSVKMAQVRENPNGSRWLPGQETGTRPACALPYELSAGGALSADRKSFSIELSAATEIFGPRAAGAPFRVYAPGPVRPAGKPAAAFENGRAWDYAVAAGDRIEDSYRLDEFADGQYHLRVDGPNGFFREFRGSADDPLLVISLVSARDGQRLNGNAELRLVNRDSQRSLSLVVEDMAYGAQPRSVKLGAAGGARSTATVTIEAAQSFGWHDVRVRVEGDPRFAQRFAGHIETGRESSSDPVMADVKRV